MLQTGRSFQTGRSSLELLNGPKDQNSTFIQTGQFWGLFTLFLKIAFGLSAFSTVPFMDHPLLRPSTLTHQLGKDQILHSLYKS